MNLLYNIIGIHLTGGILWFCFYIGHMLIDPRERAKFERIVAGLNGKKKQLRKLTLILFSFFFCLLVWEISAYNTVKKSYKHWLN